MRGAVLRDVTRPVTIEDGLEVGEPGPGEVRVRLVASGVCHSDLSAVNGTVPAVLPMVLGHEGAGVIAAVGEGVTGVKAGDHVVLAVSPPCGHCHACAAGEARLCSTHTMAAFTTHRFSCGDEALFAMAGIGAFAEEIVVPEHSVVAVPDDLPLDAASLLGCAVLTGVGAVLNAARVTPGSSVVVFGCGGVGTSVLQGARVAGAAEIVAVDLDEQKLEDARRFGATTVVTPDALPGEIQRLTGGEGFDYGFEAIGRGSTMRSAWDATRRGGTTVVIGVGGAEDVFGLSAMEVAFSEKTLRGSIMGSGDARFEIDRLLKLWRAGRLDLDGMISQRLTLDQLHEGFESMGSGGTVRSIIEFA